ncbi:MAG: hypothetical protein IJE78_05725 [Bacteroidaceae bacterium]|nr:hypothetical protein [Bacteroidaceae bacterium]
MTKFICTRGKVLLMAAGDLDEISQDAMSYNSTLLRDIFKKSKDIDLARSFALTLMEDMRDTLEALEDEDVGDDLEPDTYETFNDFLDKLNELFHPNDEDDEDDEDE